MTYRLINRSRHSFALRRDTGKWPAFHTGIHFHNDGET